jgi:hypothetical protein
MDKTRLPNSHEQSMLESTEQCIADYPGSSIFASFVVGGLVGFAVGRLIAADDARTVQHRHAATRLGSQLLDSVMQSMPRNMASFVSAGK